MHETSNKVVKWIITGLLMGLVLCLTMPLLIGAGFTYPSADDFIMEASTKYHMSYDTPIKAPLRAAWEYYMGWQGSYVSDVLWFCVMPYSRFGLNGFRLIMVCISAFFVISVLFMACEVVNFARGSEQVNDFHGEWNKKLFLAGVLFFASLGLPETWIGKEAFYWYTAAVVYPLGFSCLLVSIGFFLKAFRVGNNKWYYILSMLFGFAASGNSLQVTSFTCSWLLLALIVTIMAAESPKKDIKWITFGPFLASFGGALFNVAAPGNYARSKATMGEVPYGVLDALKDTYRGQLSQLRRMWHDPVLASGETRHFGAG